MSFTATCHFCRHEFAVDPNGRRRLPRVTSDCRPAERTGALVVCPSCCLTQTSIADDWRGAADRAYDQYAIYDAAGGSEQKVATGAGLQGRSKVLVDKLSGLRCLPDSGRLLDVGCGNGGFLRAFSDRFPAWQLEGAEMDARHATELQTIPGFHHLHGPRVEDLTGDYDAVSLVHVLEHIEDPAALLAALRAKTNPDALLFVEVPSWRSNPFALMISDHASHFTPATLEMVVNASGWKAEPACEDWVPKELSLVARPNGKVSDGRGLLDFNGECEALRSAVVWLEQVMEQARQLASTSANFGLFGTAIAATWLYQGVAEHVRFFVDEDPQRVGRTHLGLPILAPDQVAADADVFVGISQAISGPLLSRLAVFRGRFHAAGA